MIQRMLTSALIAGFAAGLLAALLHFAFIQNLILLGEKYETGEAVHFDVIAPDAAPHSHGPPPASAASGDTAAGAPAPVEDHSAHEHSHEPAGGSDGSALSRNALTVLFSTVVYVGYALVLVAGFGILTSMGRKIGVVEGVLWGIGGFAAFHLAPAMGLAPELPGTMAADLSARQIWWWGTVLSTIMGLGVLAYGTGWVMRILGLGLLAAPHVLGAPELGTFSGVAPPELAGAFSARVLGVGLTVWAALGGLAGWLWDRSETTS